MFLIFILMCASKAAIRNYPCGNYEFYAKKISIIQKLDNFGKKLYSLHDNASYSPTMFIVYVDDLLKELLDFKKSAHENTYVTKNLGIIIEEIKALKLSIKNLGEVIFSKKRTNETNKTCKSEDVSYSEMKILDHQKDKIIAEFHIIHNLLVNLQNTDLND
ncbi:hypothetical protein H311_04607 [Anncaliia algerae PRA109]|nr:hypothetical protein H311_04607 [Anncaliia algerae PRA109]